MLAVFSLDFLVSAQRKTQVQQDGYHLVGLFNNNVIVCVASYTISPHTELEREMIVHDMSTLEGEQSKGYRSELLKHLDKYAIELRCGRTLLTSANASKFYEKNGYIAHAVALKKIHSRT